MISEMLPNFFNSLLPKVVDVIIAGKQLNKSVFGAG
mgnify:CR=1 FL=1